MCGIAGIISDCPVEGAGPIREMTEAMRHRGPDGYGYVALGFGSCSATPFQRDPPRRRATIWLGHRRLSVIDLSGSHQPLANEDRTVWTTFNGEIYNFEALRTQLIAKGHVLRESGDTEVLVHLWEEYGQRMLDHLVGMFAFVIVDLRQRTVFMARDRFGEKPLYYYQSRHGLSFASELQALAQGPGFPHRHMDELATAQYFRHGYVPSPRTIYEGVYSLPSGHCAVFADGRLLVNEYWRPRVVAAQEPADLDLLETLLDQAVSARLRSDVPLGAFLSGGIDSGLVVASMARQMSQPATTFTVTAGTTWHDESKAAQATADHLGVNHHTLRIHPDLLQAAPMLAAHYGQPFADYSNIPTYYISRESRRHVTVALTGDGGDELFAGYRRYKNLNWNNRLRHLPYGARVRLAAALRAFGYSGFEQFGRLSDFLCTAGNLAERGDNPSTTFHRWWRHTGFQPEFIDVVDAANRDRSSRFVQLYEEAESASDSERWLEVDQRMYLADDIMVKVDIASMAVSLECRAPLVDHRFVEAANSMPMSKKLDGGRTKISLRSLAARRIPERITGLPKRGFSLPLKSWLRSEVHSWSRAMLFDNRATWAPYLRPSLVERIWREHQSGRADHHMRLWIIIAWVLWWQTSR